MVDVDTTDRNVNHCFSHYGNAIIREIVDTISAARDKPKDRDRGNQNRKLFVERCSTYSRPLRVISNITLGWEMIFFIP